MSTAKPIEIFKAGTHTAMSGESLSFSEADLQASAAAYDPAVHEAPLVVGHPRHDAPAYGWVKSVQFADGSLTAAPDQVDAQFAEAVAAGRYKKISASFYTPSSPSNPVPGVYYLRHVGFLGAQPPAVKGLKPVSFSEAEEGVVEFGDWNDTVNAGLWRRLREWIIGKFGIEEADRVVDGYAVQSLEALAVQEAAPAVSAMPGFAEAANDSQQEEIRMNEELKAREAAIAKREAELQAESAAFAEREAKLHEKELQARRDEAAEFCDGLIKAGRLLPAQRDGLVEFICGLGAEQMVEFGEGDAKMSKSGEEWLREFLAGLPQQVSFGEAAPAAQESETVSFSAPAGYTVDPAALEVHQKAEAYRQANPNIEYRDAVKAVIK